MLAEELLLLLKLLGQRIHADCFLSGLGMLARTYLTCLGRKDGEKGNLSLHLALSGDEKCCASSLGLCVVFVGEEP